MSDSRNSYIYTKEGTTPERFGYTQMFLCPADPERPEADPEIYAKGTEVSASVASCPIAVRILMLAHEFRDSGSARLTMHTHAEAITEVANDENSSTVFTGGDLAPEPHGEVEPVQHRGLRSEDRRAAP